MKENDNIVKRIEFPAETYKELKKMAIDMELDNDGKISPKMIGMVIEKLVLSKKQNTD